MKVVDLTHLITPDMPVYPGTEGPKFESANTYEKDGFKETRLTMYTHTGTHMDPPAHLYLGGTTLDQFPISQFVGTAVTIDCSKLHAGQQITMDFIKEQKEVADKAEFLLFYTGWEHYWGKKEYFGDYPYINDEVANYLIQKKKKGVGFDTIGLDPISDSNLTLHKKLFLNNEIVVIENLKNLSHVGTEMFTFCALPLYHVDADGSPIRAIAILGDDK